MISCIPTECCLLRQRPLVGRGSRRDGLAFPLKLNNGRFEPDNISAERSMINPPDHPVRLVWDFVCGLDLSDPTAWTQPPTN